MKAHLLLLALGIAPFGRSAITLYNTIATTATATGTDGAAAAAYTGLAAYDTTRLTPPNAPSPAVTAMAVEIPADPWGAGYQLSVQQKGNFLGFSVEMSVAESILGDTGGNMKPVFLNYLANIRNRAGAGALVRVGGNTQEKSTLFVDGLKDGTAVDKIYAEGASTTSTPVINYSLELLYSMANISALTDTAWYFGLCFNETAVETKSPNVPLAASWAQKILGDNLLGIAMGNEPDLYADHYDRDTNYTVNDYYNEFESMRDFIIQSGEVTNNRFLMGPSVCCSVAGFGTDDVWNTGWMENNVEYLAAVTVQHYPNNNCQVNGNVINAQDIFADYLNHTNVRSLASMYTTSAQRAVSNGREIVMLETNTASCGGFPGLSDSFGAAMWMLDWSLQLACTNFTAALMHVGGQNVYYNPFTPPPSSKSQYGWTTGSVYYPTLVIAEAFGRSNTSQIIDLNPGSENYPSYAIYENGVPVRAVLFNYVTDSSGGSDYTAVISFNGSTIGDSVRVRYFSASSTAEQYDIKWAGQSLNGYAFASDGRLTGDLTTEQVGCENGQCSIKVPAPSVALVFFTDEAFDESQVPTDATVSYETTIVGSGHATMAAAALKTGNGISPPSWIYTSTASPTAQVQIGVAVLAITAAVAFGVVRGSLSL